MPRLIDADAFKMEDFRHCLDCDSIIQVIKYAPTIEAEPQWIPVTERLPEKHTIVLCYKDGQRRLGYYIGAEYGKGVAAFRHPKDQFAFGVTHWMPLPEPPKDGGDE